jgi:hypothetical protein
MPTGTIFEAVYVETLGDFVLLSPLPIETALPRGYIDGCKLENDGSDADHDLVINIGAARSSDNTANIVLAAAITKRIDASWAVGTAQGGLDGSESSDGTPDASTWYHVHLIRRLDTGVVDVLFSESATAPTLPTDYDVSRRIGAVRTNSSANIVAFVQNGDRFDWEDPPLDVDQENAINTTASSHALTVPPSTEAVFNLMVNDSGSNNVYVSPLHVDDEAPATNAGPLASLRSIGGGINVAGPFRMGVNASSQVRLRADATMDAVRIATLGWIDTRGRDA